MIPSSPGRLDSLEARPAAPASASVSKGPTVTCLTLAPASDP